MEIGIDIGTSFSSVAVLEKGKAVPIKPGKETVYSIPSAVYADGKTLMIGRLAEVNRKKNPTCFKAEFKKNFGTDEPYILGEMRVKPEQIYTEYYKFFKESAEQYAGEKVEKAYLTHPAQYGKEKKELLRRAAQYAGLFHVELLQEPVAAGMSFFSDRELREGEILLVYDFGGGTFDTALLKMEKDGLRLLGEPMGMECGGTTFDRMLYRNIIGKLPGKEEVQEAVKRPKFQWLVMEQAVEIKHLLSSCGHVAANIPMGFGEFIECGVTREEFTQMIAAKVKESMEIVKEMLKKTGIKIENVDKILCVGGTARIPFIMEQLEIFAGKPVLKSLDPELAVCCGAALKGKIKVEEPPEKPELQATENTGKDREQVLPDCTVQVSEQTVNSEGDSFFELGCDYFLGLSGKADKGKGIIYFEQAVAMHSVEAMYTLGHLYADEDHVQQNYAKALRWFEKAAKHGDVQAQCEIGVIYDQGLGVKTDSQQAFHWYQKAAEGGSAKALKIMGKLYQTGRIVDQDEVQAVFWYEKAAEKGDKEAAKLLDSLKEKREKEEVEGEDLDILFDLAMSSYFGKENYPVDSRKSFEYFKKAAEKGHREAQYMLGVLYEEEMGCGLDLQAAIKWYRKAAERGNPDAQEKMAEKNEKGQGVPKDIKEAVKWRKMAAEQGNIVAQNELGTMYLKGQGVLQSYPEAVRWYRKAAEQGNSAAQFNLGTIYRQGMGTIKADTEEALKWLRKAAEQGDADAQALMGIIYQNGQGVSQDEAEAERWYEKAIEQNDATAMNNLGVIYKNRRTREGYQKAFELFLKAAEQGYTFAQYNLAIAYETGQGVSENYKAAAEWYLKAAGAGEGDVDAMFRLGQLYFRGSKDLEQNYGEACSWFILAAEQGHVKAKYALGLMYENGWGGKADVGEAVKWYQKAAQAGDADAQCNLGCIYEQGRDGVPQNYHKAVHWFEKGAEQGEATCQRNLGLMYEYGRGVPKDKKKARKWYEKAAKNGSEEAEERLRCLKCL